MLSYWNHRFGRFDDIGGNEIKRRNCPREGIQDGPDDQLFGTAAGYLSRWKTMSMMVVERMWALSTELVERQKWIYENQVCQEVATGC
jgi:hypothetical protein